MNYYDLTNPQKSIWSMEEYYKGTNINNIGGTLTIKQDVDIDVLNKALNIFIKNNKSFGLNFKQDGEKIVQYFTQSEYVEHEVIKLKDYKSLYDFSHNFTQHVFDINDKKLYIFKLFKLDNGYGGVIGLLHHIISDAATFGIMAKEIVEIYKSLLENTEIEDKTFSYLDYIESEKKYMSSSKLKKDEEYWNNLYSSIPEVASIPSISSKSCTHITGLSKRKEYLLTSDLLDKITSFCKKNKVSNFNFFMAIYSIYLSRVSGLRDFVIGTPILNRTNFEEKHTTGMFINTAALRINISDNLDFLTFIKQIATSSLSMLRYQKYPYNMLLQNLRKKEGTIPTLYDVMLSYQITKSLDKTVGIPYEVEWQPASTISSGIYIHLHDNNDTGTLSIAYDYQVEKYDQKDIENMHNRVLYMIDQVLLNENCLEQDIEITTEEEKDIIFTQFNNTKLDYSQDKTIIDLFENQVNKTPNDIALIFEDTSLTYKELNEKANFVAQKLIDNNIKPKDVVGVFLPRSLNLIISIFAILKCGATYMPLYTGLPDDRIDYMLKNSNTKLVLTNSTFQNRLGSIAHIKLSDNLVIDNFQNFTSYSSTPSDIAYIIYTSGSTGKPKGVQITNKCLNNFVSSFDTYFSNVTNKDTFLSSTSISFDVSIFEIFVPLLNGASLVLYHNELIQDILDYCDTIVKYGITGLYIPPNILEEVYTLLNSKNNLKIDKLLVGVEAIKKETLDKYFLLNPNMHIVNGYGPTETTICCTALPYTKNLKFNTDIVPIGKPLHNDHIYILDTNKKLLPVGIAGELYVTGDGIGAGYINNEEETAKNYISNTFDSSSEKMYKTGDIGKWNEDGTISLSGRKDNQVKISGYRIELGEIDSVIMSYPNIEKSITIVSDIRNKKRIVSYFTSSKEVLTQELIIYLNDKLPFYMIPYKLILLDNLPLTPNGKIDKKALPSPVDDESKKFSLPQNDIQKELLTIWANLFGLDKIDINDNFFELGGDSLLSMKLVSRIYDKFNIRVSIKDIFTNPTISLLSNTISKLSNSMDSDKITIPIEPQKDFYPVSSAQKRMYLASSMEENSYLYNITGGILLDTMPDIHKLQVALNKIVSRHEPLRTYFEVYNGKIVQKIADNFQVSIDIEDVNTNDVDSLLYIYECSFNLKTPHLFNVVLFKLPNGKVLLMLDVHHIIFDGISLNNFIHELSSLYNGNEVEKLNISYKDFSSWENRELLNDSFKSSKEFWLKEFSDDIPVLDLPTSYPRPEKRSYAGTSFITSIDMDLNAKLNVFANKYNITPYMFMLSCYYILLYKYTNQEDIVVGTPVSGRLHKDTEPLLGMFVNSIPLRNTILPGQTFSDFINQIKTSCINAFAHQDYPFDLLVNDLKIPKDASRSPIFDTMFTYQSNGIEHLDFDGIEAKIISPIPNSSKFDISLEVLPQNNELTLSFEYCTKLFDEAFIINFARHYENIVKFILNHPDSPISNISMLDDEERNDILYRFNKLPLSDINMNNNIFKNQLENYNDSDNTLYKENANLVNSNFTNFTNYDNMTLNNNFNNRVYILDKDMNVCPVGIPGEMYIAGESLNTRYVDNSEMAKSNFMPDICYPNKLMYKTSDIAKYLPNGEIYYMGNRRKDTKQKVESTSIETKVTSSYTSPISSLEKQIEEIFKKLLSVSNVGIDDNFFDLGGDSLAAINLQIELLKLNLKITYSDIFTYPTIRTLSQKLSSSKSSSFSSINESDFLEFDKLLSVTTDMPNNIDYKELGNIILTGATGFLGAHILENFIINNTGKVYCLIRESSSSTLEDKLLEKLHFYFGNKYDKYIGNRIIIVSSDISRDNMGLSLEKLEEIFNDVDCIVNSAAKVSHYGEYEDYKKINVDGIETLLKFCLQYNKRFYQISTLTVSGVGAPNQPFEDEVIFRENNLYINQSLSNVYARSKFEAEKLIMKYILKGLDAYILRVGNLMNRFLDSKFQPNVNENAYVGRLISLLNMQCIPSSLLNAYLEFTPVDFCASAIMKLVQHNTKSNRVFHLYNYNHVQIMDFINIVRKRISFDIVSDDIFADRINEMLKEANSDKLLAGILRDLDDNKKLSFDTKIKINSDFSIKYLQKIGFIWPIIDEKYISNFLDYFHLNGYMNFKEE